MDEREYFPRRISLVVPLGESVHQFIIVGEDRVGVLSKITQVIADHNVNLMTGGTYDAEEGEQFIFSVFADFAGADCKPEDLAAELAALPFVSKVSSSHTEDAVYDQQLFPVLLFEANRAVIVPGESIAFMERDLQRQIGKQGMQVLFEVGRSSGLSITALHRNMLPDADRDALLATAKDDMRARGWGLVTVQVAAKAVAKTKVTVTEPIFAGIEGARESWWLMGLVSGFLEAIYGHRTVVSGRTTYQPESRVFSFELVEFTPDSRSNKALA